MIAGVPYDAEIAYLEGTGTQWIDTGFDPSSKQVKIALDFQIVNTGYNQFNWCTGFQYSATFVGAYPDTSSDVFYQARYKYSQNADKYAKTKAVYDGTHPNTNGAGSLLIFARRALDGSVPKPGGSKRIFGLSIIYSGVLVTDMIPVRVGQVGYMYDRVSRKLFGNAGTGAFVLGPDVARPVMGIRRYAKGMALPPGARRLAYLESTGTQWIDTGIVPTYATKVECAFSTTQDIASSNRNYIFGADNLARGIQFSYSPTAFFGAGGLYDNTYSLSVDRNRHKIVVEQSKFYLDGTLVFTGGNNYTTTLPLALFANSSSSSQPSFFSYARIYGCDIYGNGSLIRSFRPIAIGNTGYMFDTVEERIYGNKGSGDFMLGELN